MAELEPLNENDTGSFKPKQKAKAIRKEPSAGPLVAKRYLLRGCRLVCEFLYALFGALSLAGGYLFFRQLYDYFAEGAWANGSLLAVIGYWVPAEYLKGWFPARPSGDSDYVYWFLEHVPASVFLLVVGLGVLLFLTSIRWNLIVWEQQIMVRINTLRGK